MVKQTNNPGTQAIACAFLEDGALCMLYFLGAVPFHFDKHRNEAVAILENATFATTTDSASRHQEQ